MDGHQCDYFYIQTANITAFPGLGSCHKLDCKFVENGIHLFVYMEPQSNLDGSIWLKRATEAKIIEVNGGQSLN